MSRLQCALVSAIHFTVLFYMWITPTSADSQLYEFVVSRGLVIFMWVHALDLLRKPDNTPDQGEV